MGLNTAIATLGLAFFFGPQVVLAQAQAPDERGAAEAAARFQRAVELYREGGYEGALAEFRKAYQISPSYRVLYNIAQAQYALHDFVSAYQSLVQYMSEGGGEIAADRRAQVDEMMARLRERIAHLQISTNLAGAEIRVDGVSVGTSPLAGAITVNVGTRRVSAFKEGSPEAVRVVTVAGKENLKIDLRMDEPEARSALGVAGSGSKSAPAMVRTQGRAEPPSRAPLIVSLSATATLAVATGVLGYLALDAQRNLNNQVNTYPSSRDQIESARSKSKNYAYATDAFGAATLVSGGIALYLALTHDWSKTKSAKMNKTVVLAPTLGGMVLQGAF